MQEALWARRLVVAILLVVCPRLMLFWVDGVAGVDVPPAWLPWIDALMGGATGVVMTGGQMYLAHHLASTSLVRAPGGRRAPPGGRRRVQVLLSVLWLVAVVAAVVIGSAHVAMQTSRRELLEVLRPEWILANPLVWGVALIAVGSLELMATGIAVASADARARAHHEQVHELEQRADAALRARNAQADESARLARRLQRLEAAAEQAAARAPGAAGAAEQAAARAPGAAEQAAARAPGAAEQAAARAPGAPSAPSAAEQAAARAEQAAARAPGAPSAAEQAAARAAEQVQLVCRHGCGWISDSLPVPSAKKAESAHAGWCRRRPAS